MANFSIDKKKLINVLKDMIRIESVNPSLYSGGQGEAKIANYIWKLFDRNRTGGKIPRN